MFKLLPSERGEGSLEASLITFFLAIVLISLCGCFTGAYTDNYTDIRVDKTEIVSQDDYLVWAVELDDRSESLQTFSVNDSLYFGKWHSSTTYGSIDVGGCYTIRYNGMRIGWLSNYKNILETTPIDCPEEEAPEAINEPELDSAIYFALNH